MGKEPIISRLPNDPVTPVLGIYASEVKSMFTQKLYQDVISSYIRKKYKMKTTQISTTGERINKLWHIHTTEYY